MTNITIEIQDNGYKAENIQPMIAVFNKVAAKMFPRCTVRHFYYGDKLDMVNVEIKGNRSFPGYYAHFNISKNRVSLNGYTCDDESLMKFISMTHNDECYAGKLLELAKEF